MNYYEHLDISPHEYIETNAAVLDLFSSLSYLQMLNDEEDNSHKYAFRFF